MMKMNKLFTGLVAFVAGFALSAGSALATKGYVIGDPAHMKLIPHYSTGATMATIIGIQNIDSGDDNATECTAIDDAGADGVPEACLVDPDADKDKRVLIKDDDGTTDVNELTEADKAADGDDPMNLIVSANIHDSMGAMMGSTQLCLGSHQFGYIILQEGMAMPGQMTAHRGEVMSVMGDEIPANGYVTLTGTDRVEECSEGYTTPNDVKVTSDDAVMPAIAAWTIVQDVGMGFFGTEVPTSTITMTAPDDDGNTMLDCHRAVDEKDERSGDFDMGKCGLIPEMHTMDAARDGDTTKPDPSPSAHVFARYDVGGDSTVFVWLGTNGDDAETKDMVEQHELSITVRCEEGAAASIDDPSENVADTLDVATLRMGMTMMIDPSMYEVGSFTDMCMGDRGVLQFSMPEGSMGGMVWTHVAQDMDHYRMNFPGYSMAPPM